ncbi:MAG: hypothetical protein FJ027_04360 [Candidatus Rokubacteria bacterium]|nr:hypothetical protein [Candidatus Rokubacteria bacterium]
MTPRELADAVAGHAEQRRHDRAFRAAVAAGLSNILAPSGVLTTSLTAEAFLSDDDQVALMRARMAPLAKRARARTK